MESSDPSTNGEDVCPYKCGQVLTKLNQTNKDRHLDKCKKNELEKIQKQKRKSKN